MEVGDAWPFLKARLGTGYWLLCQGHGLAEQDVENTKGAKPVVEPQHLVNYRNLLLDAAMLPMNRFRLGIFMTASGSRMCQRRAYSRQDSVTVSP